MHRCTTAVAVLVAALALAAPAGAQETNAPPGNSGVDEYLESVPEAGGNRPTNRDPGRSPLSAATRARLEQQGTDGRAAADLAERTEPGKQLSPGPAVARDDGGGALGALGRAAGGSDEGMGLWLPVLITLGAAGALAAMLLRRRFNRQ